MRLQYLLATLVVLLCMLAFVAWPAKTALTVDPSPDDDRHRLILLTEADLNQDVNASDDGNCCCRIVWTLPTRGLRRLAARWLLHPGDDLQSAQNLLGPEVWMDSFSYTSSDYWWYQDGIAVTVDDNDRIQAITLSEDID